MVHNCSASWVIRGTRSSASAPAAGAAGAWPAATRAARRRPPPPGCPSSTAARTRLARPGSWGESLGCCRASSVADEKVQQCHLPQLVLQPLGRILIVPSQIANVQLEVVVLLVLGHILRLKRIDLS